MPPAPVQVTSRLAPADAALTVGVEGASGGSSTLVTLTVTTIVASTDESARSSGFLPSLTDTVRRYDLVASKSSAFAAVTVIAPLESMSNTAFDLKSSE